jgi:hypothetical protein
MIASDPLLLFHFLYTSRRPTGGWAKEPLISLGF